MTIDRRFLFAEGDRDPVLARIVEQLRGSTAAARTTIRGPVLSLTTTTALLAESLGEGVRSMTTAPPSGIEEAGTYTYLRSQRRPLVQPDCAEGPRPPASLTDVFQVTAQLLGPLLDGDTLIGTVSVHHEGGTREWTTADLEALERAVACVRSRWGLS